MNLKESMVAATNGHMDQTNHPHKGTYSVCVIYHPPKSNDDTTSDIVD